MVNRRGLLAGLAVLLVSMAAGAPAGAHEGDDPERIYEACVKKLREIVTRCQHEQAETAHRCIAQIKKLLEEGKRHEAELLARQCIRHIHELTSRCVSQLHATCRHCIEALLKLGAERLAKRLQEECELAVRAVRHSERRAIEAIRDALR